jgi:Mg-chelatase subunit ChlD
MSSPRSSIRSSLNRVGIPLGLGVAAALAATVALIGATTPNWMVDVSKSLEAEETASLSRLSKAQGAFTDEIMGQYITEVNAITRFAQDVFVSALDPTFTPQAGDALDPMFDFVATQNLSGSFLAGQDTAYRPRGTYIWAYPYSSNEGVLEVGSEPSRYEESNERLGPGGIVGESQVCRDDGERSSCWVEPESSRNSFRQLEMLRDGTRGSTKSSSVMWPPVKTGPDANVDTNNLPAALLQEIRITGLLEDIFAETYASNPTIVLLYVGTEKTGIMRQYPYAHQTTGLSKRRYAAAATAPYSTTGGQEYYGYDPRKRPWYAEAKDKKKMIVSAPYVYSTPPFPVGITVAQPIYHPDGTLYGVIGLDVTVSVLENVIVASSILMNGYAYLVTTDFVPVVYPCSRLGGASEEACNNYKCVWNPSAPEGQSPCSTPNEKKLRDFEFVDPANAGAFQTKLWAEWSDLLDKKEWAFTYDKRRMQSYETGTRAEGAGDNEKWHVAIAPVPSASYALALVVPDSDIQAPAIRVSASIAAAIGVNIGVFIGLCVAGFFVFVYVLNFVSKAVVRPVDSLKQVIDLIIRDLSRAKNDAADKPSRSKSRFRLNINDLIHEEDEMCKEVHMMKDSFEYMIQALRFGSSAFSKNDFDAAEKVYGDALTMYKTLNNRKGEGIVTFNLGATSHRRWLVSDKTDARMFTRAEKFYMASIAIAREQWQQLRSSSMESDGSGSETRAPAGGVAVNVEMTNMGAGEGKSDAGDAGQTVAGVEVGSVGHDIADRLSGRLYQLAQLYSDVGTVDAGKAAKPLLEEALRWDAKTNNVLGFASRLGLLSRILVVLGDFPKANRQLTEQLDMLRERLLHQERSDTLADMNALVNIAHGSSKFAAEGKRGAGGKRNQTRASVTKGQQRAAKRKLMSEQERDELFQALQHALKDAAVIQGCAQGDDHLALRYFIEALSCSPRTAPHVLNGIFQDLGRLVDRHRTDGTLPGDIIETIDKELETMGAVASLPKDIIFVVDYSGSMSGGKIRRARKGVQDVVAEQVTALDRASVIKFNGRVQILTQSLVPASSSELHRAIAGLTSPNGGTALWDGIGAALSQLRDDQRNRGMNQQNDNREPWIICVTDGEDNRSRRDEPASLARDIATQGANIIILSVGVDSPAAMSHMRKVVSGASDDLIGELIDIEGGDQLDEAFRTITAMIGDHVQIEHH